MSKNKVSFETEAVRREFAASKSIGINKYVKTGMIAVVAAILLFVGYGVISNSIGRNNGAVDWLGYGKTLSEIETKYDDCDKVILRVGGNEIKKLEFYKLRTAQDYLFNTFMKEYDDYVKNNDTLTKEELAELKPHVLTDEEIVDNLIRTEIGYIAAMDAGLEMDYDIAYTKINSMYYYYLELIDKMDEMSSIAIKAQDFITQAELVSEGMGITVNDYVRYLSRESMKSMAMSMLEEEWQADFEKGDYDGDIDDYIEKRYKNLESVYEIERLGLNR